MTEEDVVTSADAPASKNQHALAAQLASERLHNVQLELRIASLEEQVDEMRRALATVRQQIVGEMQSLAQSQRESQALAKQQAASAAELVALSSGEQLPQVSRLALSLIDTSTGNDPAAAVRFAYALARAYVDETARLEEGGDA